MKTLLKTLLLILGIAAIVSCAEEEESKPTVTGIEITPPAKTTYYEGELLDLTGIVVSAVYSDGSKKDVTDYIVSPDTNTALKVSNKVVAVSWKNYQRWFSIKVLQNDYSITWKLNGGEWNTGYTAPVSYSTHTEFSLPENLHKDGFFFAGWYKTDDFSGERITSIPAGTTGRKTFYAKWNNEVSCSVYQLETILKSYSGEVIDIKITDNDPDLSKLSHILRNTNAKTNLNLLDCNGLTTIKYKFDNCTSLKSIVIPDNVTRIGDYAFEGCSGLTSITIPGVWTIGNGAFRGCTGLTSITLGNGVTSIGVDAFSGCSNLKDVHYTGTLAQWLGISFSSSSSNPWRYGADLYINNEKVTEVVIPDGVTSIGDYAFYGCTGLTSITIPNSVTSIGEGVFNGCSSLESMTIPFVGGSANATRADRTTLFGYIFGTLGYTGGEGTCQYYGSDYNSCVTYYIPSSLRSVNVTGGKILYGAFQNCSMLTSITIPNSVTSIGSSAFSGCFKLTSITIPDGVTSIGDDAFRGCSRLTSITLPDRVTNIGDYAFSGCSRLTSITLPDGVTSIGDDAFRGCSGLTSITIGDGVTSIGSYAFYDCSRLKSITIPDGVTSIGSYAFYGCSGLTSITIPNNVTSIGSSAFSGCFKLTSITIPDGVTSIGTYAFGYCSGLTSVTIGNGVKSIGDYTFYGCSGLTSITIPNSVTSIGTYAFDECSNIKEVHYTGTLAQWLGISFSNYYSNPCYYGADLYINNEKVTELVIPDGVTSIGSYAFYHCSRLTSITIPNSVTSIGTYAFRYCSGLTSVTIGNGVKSIGNDAFYGCSGLTSITLGNGVKSIGEFAFDKCSNIKEVHYTGTLAQWLGISFSNYSNPCNTGADLYINNEKVTELVIPDGVTSIGAYTFYGCSGLTSITIPNSVTSIAYRAFGDCTGLTSIKYRGSESDWNNISKGSDTPTPTIYNYTGD